MKKLTLSLAAALAAAFASQAGTPSAVLFDPDTGTLLVPTNLSVASITVSTTNLSGSAGFGNVTNLVKLPAATRTNVVLEKSDGTLTTNDLADFVKIGSLPSFVVTNGSAVTWTNNAGIYGDGSGLTNLNASQLASGSVPPGRLYGGVPTLVTNASTLVTNAAIDGFDGAFKLGFITSAATPQGFSNYLTITLSAATSTNPVVVTISPMAWGSYTNSTVGAALGNVRLQAITTSNTITFQSLVTAPSANTAYGLAVHVDRP